MDASKAEEAKSQQDPAMRIQWIKARIQTAFKHLKGTVFTANFEKGLSAVNDFLDNAETRTLFYVGDSMKAFLRLPRDFHRTKGTVMYFLKAGPQTLTPETMESSVMFGELSANLLTHLEAMLRTSFCLLSITLATTIYGEKWPAKTSVKSCTTS